jgi:hypothetical protein
MTIGDAVRSIEKYFKDHSLDAVRTPGCHECFSDVKDVENHFRRHILDPIRIICEDGSFMYLKLCGVYVFVNDAGKRYVGCSSNIFERLRKHSKLYFIKVVFVLMEDDIDEAYRIERQMIVDIEPELNNIIYGKRKDGRVYGYMQALRTCGLKYNSKNKSEVDK